MKYRILAGILTLITICIPTKGLVTYLKWGMLAVIILILADLYTKEDMANQRKVTISDYE